MECTFVPCQQSAQIKSKTVYKLLIRDEPIQQTTRNEQYHKSKLTWFTRWIFTKIDGKLYLMWCFHVIMMQLMCWFLVNIRSLLMAFRSEIIAQEVIFVLFLEYLPANCYIIQLFEIVLLEVVLLRFFIQFSKDIYDSALSFSILVLPQLIILQINKVTILFGSTYQPPLSSREN